MTELGNEGSENDGGAGSGYRPVIHGVGLCLALTVCWLLLSGYFQILLLGLGAASILFCVWIAVRMDLIDHEGVPLHITWAGLRYLPWLLWEIVKANIDVARRVIAPSLPISPSLFNASVSQKTDLGQVIYANSITLTPGTVSVNLDPGVILVHALHDGAADGVLEGEMDKRVSQVEGQD
ncbi:MAG: Na+/H+ antiporter subunit E [Alphaproteobacteria bacterium]|nr:Na+/H+ antiporter subunit E [Alphaproteobacteria bacterium]MDP6254583.1 Na+/H+ antiporter subunit E [Alphaproteobacteria bacterium]MDP7053673.1 Na+/H+ antiporter subunit E [Alphaproteobacteria bacterium]MDP7230680.1 Na+/H+ antiporter subunit E [Alphaproteobacteria bacterium]HJM91392.1 Na+/H+ antiporter subunit E [Alphaproteobacteria bacterium]